MTKVGVVAGPDGGSGGKTAAVEGTVDEKKGCAGWRKRDEKKEKKKK